MSNRRDGDRKKMIMKTVIRKAKPEGGYAIMEFKSNDLSLGGIFISTEDLTILDLGQDVELMVEVNEEKYYEGNGKIVRSARVFSEAGEQIESGYGVMFLNPDESFKEMVSRNLAGD